MQNISALESQIARELMELDRIQGVLRSFQGSHNPPSDNKENQKPAQAIRPNSGSARKKSVKPLKLDKVSPVVEKSSSGREKKQMRKQIELEIMPDNNFDSLKEFLILEQDQKEKQVLRPVAQPCRKSSVKPKPKPPKPRADVCKRSMKSIGRSEDSSDNFEGLSDMILGNKSNKKSALELGHEQFEKMCSRFRQARMNTKSFDERVKLLVLEVDLYDQRKKIKK